MKLSSVLVSVLCTASLAALGCSSGTPDDSSIPQSSLSTHQECTYGSDCPLGEGCASDGHCHADDECTNAWGADGYLSSTDCAEGQICAAATGGDPLIGFCTDGRGGPDPYCRADGTGACRALCATDDDCFGFGSTCEAGFCHSADECTTDADCSPNHHCGTVDGWDDYGYQTCLENEDPTCVDDGHGACRLACDADGDCLDGGGCAADGLCHASNECGSDADCDDGLICYADDSFGGLCGPPRD